MIIEILAIAALILTLVVTFSMLTHLFTPVPYVPTSMKIVEKMVDLADLQNGDIVYDLGAGDGRLLIASKRKCPNITGIGFELLPTVCIYAKLRIFFSRQNVAVHWGDIFKQDLSDADVVYLYLFPKVMDQLLVKFQNELKPGTRLVSHAFKLKDREPIKVIDSPSFNNKSKQLFLYEW